MSKYLVLATRCVKPQHKHALAGLWQVMDASFEDAISSGSRDSILKLSSNRKELDAKASKGSLLSLADLDCATGLMDCTVCPHGRQCCCCMCMSTLDQEAAAGAFIDSEECEPPACMSPPCRGGGGSDGEMCRGADVLASETRAGGLFMAALPTRAPDEVSTSLGSSSVDLSADETSFSQELSHCSGDTEAGERDPPDWQSQAQLSSDGARTVSRSDSSSQSLLSRARSIGWGACLCKPSADRQEALQPSVQASQGRSKERRRWGRSSCADPPLLAHFFPVQDMHVRIEGFVE